ncbi:MAG: MEDS domain-containing protein [Desulfovibrio sp.]|nr:MEDS domain-containing protein [Desulfovibrio sp.]MBI4959213.1 MEDS domain-containing protein [Desulfovibrio sp.]
MSDRLKISLGFTGQQFEPGVHICQIFSEDNERQDALLQFILSGLQAGERVSCFSEKATEEALDEYLSNFGISYSKVRESGSLTLSGTRQVYYQDDRFDPERMLGLLRTFYEDATGTGYRAARVIGEMTPEVQHLPGGSRLLEYESRVSMLLRQYPVTAVCQYDARSFDGATIMDVLKVHPYMIVRNSVVHNPFFIAPEQYLQSERLM